MSYYSIKEKKVDHKKVLQQALAAFHDLYPEIEKANVTFAETVGLRRMGKFFTYKHLIYRFCVA